MTVSSQPTDRRMPPGVWLAFFIAASIVGLTVTTQIYFGEGRAQWSFPQLVTWQLPGWYFWAGVAPLIWRLARPISFRNAAERRAAGLVVGAAITLDLGYVLVHTAASFVAGIPHGSFAAAYFGQLTTRFHYGLITFAAILSGAYAVEYGRQLHASEVERLRTAKELAEVRVSALQMQLRPHFLFNTLNTIAMLVREAGARRALDVVLHLSSLLRRVTQDSESRTTTVRDEFDFLSHYLEIERVRFEDRLTVVMDAAAETVDAAVPALLLQPIVENALRHGIARTVDSGTVRVNAARAGSRLRMTVSDDGPGFDPSSPPAGRKGLGLSLVRSRLEQEFHGNFQLEIHSSADGRNGAGTTVIIDLPFRRLHAEPSVQHGSQPA